MIFYCKHCQQFKHIMQQCKQNIFFKNHDTNGSFHPGVCKCSVTNCNEVFEKADLFYMGVQWGRNVLSHGVAFWSMPALHTCACTHTLHFIVCHTSSDSTVKWAKNHIFHKFILTYDRQPLFKPSSSVTCRDSTSYKIWAWEVNRR